LAENSTLHFVDEKEEDGREKIEEEESEEESEGGGGGGRPVLHSRHPLMVQQKPQKP
jgi:hypothetical protein